jgi:RHS repeat-associated protein
VSITYDPVYGRTASVNDGSGTTTFEYQTITTPLTLGTGRLKSIDGPFTGDTIEFGYDELGRVVTRSIAGAANLETRTLDALGRLSGLTNALGQFTYAYDGVASRQTSVTYPTGQLTTYAYFDALGDYRLREIHNKRADGATISRFEYGYDLLGNVSAWRQEASGEAATAYELGYDQSDQLTAAILKTTTATPEILKRYYYSYDAAGNRTAEQIDDAVTSATYNNMNQLASQQAGGALIFKGTVSEPGTVTVGGKPATVTADNRFEGQSVVPAGTGQVAVTATDPSGNTRTNTYEVTQGAASKVFTYDLNGNMISDGPRTYEWDVENRLVAVHDGSHSTEFAYDAFGRRWAVTEKEGGAVVSDRRYVRCSSRLCEERDASGAVVLARFFDDGKVEAGTPYFYSKDHLGSVREISQTDGMLRGRYAFDMYGRRTQTQGNIDSQLGFTGHETYLPSGLIGTHYRLYDPSLATWLSEDRIAPVAGESLYQYVESNPVKLWDPDGAEGAAATIKKWCKRIIPLAALGGAVARMKKNWDCGTEEVECFREVDQRCWCQNKPDWGYDHAARIVDRNTAKRFECVKTYEGCCKSNYWNCVKRKLSMGMFGGPAEDCFGDLPPCDAE